MKKPYIYTILKGKTPRKLMVGLLSLSSIVLMPSLIYAQQQQGCFMLDENGQTIDLGGLCGNSNPQNVNRTGKVSVPIKRKDGGIPVIDVVFNNKHTFEMMVDTGASATVISPKMAKTMGLEVEGIFLADTPSQTGVVFPTGRVGSIATGGIIVKDVVVVISPAISVGLLGQNFFSTYDVLIKKEAIEFHRR